MRIPPAYQTQALSKPLLGSQESKNPTPNEVRETSVSMRLGKLGITYSIQDARTDPSAPSETFSRPTTSFAQEFSLALDTQSGQFLPDQTTSSSSASSCLARTKALQAYDQQVQMQQTPSVSDFSAVA